MKKLVLATIAGYVALMATNYVVHSIWLMADYAAIPASHRSPEGMMHRFWAMLIGQFFFAALFAYIYQRGIEPNHGPAREFATRSWSHSSRWFHIRSAITWSTSSLTSW